VKGFFTAYKDNKDNEVKKKIFEKTPWRSSRRSEWMKLWHPEVLCSSFSHTLAVQNCV
jgi:hypothetical protein